MRFAMTRGVVGDELGGGGCCLRKALLCVVVFRIQ